MTDHERAKPAPLDTELETRNRELTATNAALKQSEERLRQILDFAPTAIVTLDAAGRIETINAQAERMWGYGRSEIVGQPFAMLLPERLRNSSTISLATEPRSAAAERDLYGLRKDGSEFPVELRLNPIATGAIAILRDITEEKRAAAALRASERRQAEEARQHSEKMFRTIFDASPDLISLTTPDEGRYVDVNDAFLRVWGRQREDVIGHTSMEIGFWDDPSTRAKLIAALRRDGLVRDLEAKVRTSSGEIRDFIYSIDVIRIGDSDLLLGIGHDITDLRAAEARLRQAQKAEAIGQLTGGVAHDFNNLLAIIHGNLELINEGIADATLKQMVADALRAAARGASLTNQLLAYARQQPLAPKVVQIGKLVRDQTELLRRTFGETIAIQNDIAADLWSARIDPNQLETALLNLAVNARHAMPEGGKLTIEASNAILDEEYADRNAEVVPGAYVLLAVTDTGTGMTKEVMQRALEPFFTTKAVGQGSGLGLSMVYGFVKQSEGHLKIYSEPGNGTTVRLYLPKAEGAIEASASATESVAIPLTSKGEVILVVEDDAMVRALAVRILTGLGYRTVEAQDGAAAIQLLAAAEPVDLLLTDVVLPGGMSGPQLARQAQTERPGLKVLYMSGYTKNAIIHNGVLDEGVHLLAKPFLKQELALQVRRLLDDGGNA